MSTFHALRPTRFRPTRRAVVVGGLGLALWAAGAGVSAGYVVILAALLVGTIPWAAVQARRAARSVEVRRLMPRRLDSGSAQRVVLQARIASAASVVVHDRLLGIVGVAGAAGSAGQPVGDHERRSASRDAGIREVAAEVHLRRGVARHGEVAVEVADPFGLFSGSAVGDVASTVTVAPAAARVDRADLTAAWAVEAGDRAARIGGGPEVQGTREYQHGDPARSVHWRSSARLGRLVVRQYAEDARADVALTIAAGTWDQDVLDRVCEAVAGIAEDARHQGHPVMVVADGQAVAWSPDAVDLLATLPPHLGESARPLQPVPGVRVAVDIRFTPESVAGPPGGDAGTWWAEVEVVRGGEPVGLGRLTGDADVAAWLQRALREGAST